MDLITNIPLSKYLTMKIGGPARFMAEVTSLQELKDIIKRCKEYNLKFYVIGGGSNIIARDEKFDGVIIRNRIMGMEIIEKTDTTATIKASAGEAWDDLVKLAVKHQLSGIAAMSAIPGTCGAAPVQNIGAYGEELSDTLVELEVLNTETGEVEQLENDDCNFGYRSSIFKEEHPGKYIILSITLQLFKSKPMLPFYAGLQDYFDTAGITDYTVQAVRDAVIALRKAKLPDPAQQPNSGSFFKNTIVPEWHLNNLLMIYPKMPHFDMGDGMHKIPTGWLIDQCGLKGQLIDGMRVNPANALVLINESAYSYKNLASARKKIIDAVYNKFKITIEQEPAEI